MNKFKPRTTYNLLSWNCSIVYLISGYILAIPGSSQVTWKALNKNFQNYEIDGIQQLYAFGLGSILFLGYEVRGNLRAKIIKCDITLVIVFLVQPFMPFTLGTLMARFIQGGLLSLNMRYTDKYLYQISQPLYIFQKIHYRNNPYFRMKVFYMSTVSFYAGWTLSTLFGFQLPEYQNLIHLRYYDDTLLWYLLNCFPIVLIATRLINMKLTFPFDTIQENPARKDLNEYLVANLFKKRDLGKAWDMIYIFRQTQDSINHKQKLPIYLTTLSGQLGGCLLLIVYAQDLLSIARSDQLLKIQLLISFTGLLGAVMSRCLFQKVAYEIIYIICLLGVIISSTSYVIFELAGQIQLAIISLICLSLVNGLGLSNIGYCITYYIQNDESFVFRQNLIRQVSLIVLLLNITYLDEYVVYSTIVISSIMCLYFCNSFSGLLISLERDEQQETNEVAPVMFDILEDYIEIN